MTNRSKWRQDLRIRWRLKPPSLIDSACAAVGCVDQCVAAQGGDVLGSFNTCFAWPTAGGLQNGGGAVILSFRAVSQYSRRSAQLTKQTRASSVVFL